MRRGRPLIHLVVIGLYIVLSLLLTWPLAGQFATHVPGDGGDDPAIAWNLWWVKYALVDQGVNPFDCRWMFYPLGINLAFYTLTVLNACLSIPLQAILGLVTVSNIMLLSSFVVGAYGAFLLALDVLREVGWGGGVGRPQGARLRGELGVGRPQGAMLWGDGASIVAAGLAGMIYAFSSSKLFYASLGQFNIASNQWIPFYILALLRLVRRPARVRYAALAALFLVMQGWAEMTYATFLLVFTALVLLAALARRGALEGWRQAGQRKLAYLVRSPTVRALALLALLAAAGMAPLLAAMLPDMRAEGDFFVEGSGFADVFSSDLAGYALPTQLHPLLGGLVAGMEFPHDKAQHYFLGYSVMALAALGVIAGRRSGAIRFWAFSAGFFFLLTLGPTLRINGRDTAIPLPFQVFQALPFFKGNRYPSRWGVLLVLSVAVLAGVGVVWLWGRLGRRPWRRWALSGFCAGLFLFEQLAVPLPLSDLRLPAAYDAIRAAETGQHAILDLPAAWRNGFRITGVMHPIFMYAQFYQTAHEQRLLGGNTSRNPELKFQYFTEAPVLNSLIALENGRPISAAQRELDRAAAPAALRFFDIHWIVLHKATAGAAMEDYVRAVLPAELYYDDATYAVYRVRQDALPADASPGAALGDPLSRLALGEGWGELAGGKVWAQRERARLLWEGGPALSLELRAPAAQSVFVSINRCRLGEVALSAEWQTFSFPIPAGCADLALNDVWLEAGRAFGLPAIWGESASRWLDDAPIPAEIVVRSAGKEVGDFGHIYVDGIDRSPGKRGYNFVTLDPNQSYSGLMGLDYAHFDTHLDEDASRFMAAWIEQLPAGTIVAVAAMDEASRLLGEDGVLALRSLGFSGDLRGHFRASHAGVGIKGLPAGAAREALSDVAPVTVVVGEGLTRPTRYFELRSIR